MSKDILVRLEAPFLPKSHGLSSNILFNQWLPMTNEESILIIDKEFDVKIWFDKTCIYNLRDEPIEELLKRTDIRVNKVFIDVTIKNTSEDLIAYMIADSVKITFAEETSLEYKRLGNLVIDHAIAYLNRLISYFRNEKGQYWLEEYPPDPKFYGSRNVEFKTRFQLIGSSSQWYRWKPNLETSMVINALKNDSFLKREEWQNVIDYIQSTRRTSLTLELLANSEKLLEEGFDRSAIIEAVIALEVAVNSFSKAPNFSDLNNPDIYNRLNISSLKTQIKHLGYSGTVGFLLPILFSETILPSELIKTCNEAIEIRHSIVHTGQRKIKDKNLRYLIGNIRKTCEILKRYTAKES